MTASAERQRQLERETRESLRDVFPTVDSGIHEGVTYLLHYGSVKDEDALPGHTFWLRIEESSGGLMGAGREGQFEMPWLRAQCACGWSDEQRFTIDGNARADWHKHVKRERTRIEENENEENEES